MALCRQSSATVFNLSLLTADVYTLIYAVSFLGQTFEWLYILSFVSTLGGLALYVTPRRPPPPPPQTRARKFSPTRMTPAPSGTRAKMCASPPCQAVRRPGRRRRRHRRGLVACAWIALNARYTSAPPPRELHRPDSATADTGTDLDHPALGASHGGDDPLLA